MEKKKLVFQLDTPYTAVSWPQIESGDQDSILELLCTLLSPIGKHRLQYVKPSGGKREKKRKRNEATKLEPETAIPPAPEIGQFIDVGLSVVTRNLQREIGTAVESTKAVGERDSKIQSSTSASTLVSYSAIFIARPGQPNILSNHLLRMIAAVSTSDIPQESMRLVGFSRACQDRLSKTLGIPRVSVIGLRKDAPNSKALVGLIQQQVPAVDAVWLREAEEVLFRATKINTIETTIGSKRQKGKI